jgi:cytochrome c oxidase cbb3-type subunit I/II
MPNYPWLYTNKLDTSLTQRKMTVLRQVGVPYSDEDIATANDKLAEQANNIVESLHQASVPAATADQEVIALIAYVQRLGMDIHWRDQQ